MKVYKFIPILGMFILPACQQDASPPTGGDTSDRYLEFMVDLITKAEQGDAHSQYLLGGDYEFGIGIIPQDYVQALMWYNLAASDLTGEYKERNVKNREEIAEELTAEEIAEAERLAREWKPKSSESQ